MVQLNHVGGTYSHNGMIGSTRFPISEFHLGKFPDSMAFHSWKVNFKTEVSSKSADPYLTMHRITEVEIAQSIDELKTSRSIVGHDFLDFDMLDAMIASALQKLLNTQIHFRKRVSVEEQSAQKDDRFLRGRQMAYLIYEYFRAAGACEAVQGLSDLFKFCKNPTCKFWHPPVCQNFKSGKGCIHGDKCHFRHVEAEGKPSKKAKKGGAKGSIAISEE